jgi:LacI family transcriptional regulator
VSIATASRSLSGSNGVSERVADYVRGVAEDLGYIVNPHARSLAGGSTSSIGLIVHEIGDPYFSEIASGVLRVAAQQGLIAQICHSGRDPEIELLQIRTLVAHQIGGIIIAGSGFVDPRLQAASKAELLAFRRAGGRVAVIGRHHVAADAVLPDNLEGGRSVGEHVLSLGHRRIAIASGSRGLTTVADRIAGIEAALHARGRTLADVPIIEADFTRDGGKVAAARILAEHADVTAVMALNDAMAIGVLSTFRSHGVDVPGDVSVTGFDDVAVAEDLAPGLTTIRLPMASMGELALTLALKPPAARPRRQQTGHTLVVRASTGPAKAR